MAVTVSVISFIKLSVFAVYSTSCGECVHKFHVKLQHVVQFSLRSTSYLQNINY